MDLQQYAIAAALITSGITTIMNISKTPVPFSEKIWGRQLYIGSGVLSVMGTSFTFLPIFEIGIRQQVADGVDSLDAYGAMLGTSMLCALLEFFFSLFPLKWIKAVFPPLVTSITVILIGVALCGTGMKYWGGGVVCADMVWKEHGQINATASALIPENPSVGFLLLHSASYFECLSSLTVRFASTARLL